MPSVDVAADVRVGAVVSTVIDRASDALDTFPATSVTFAVMAWPPFERGLLESTVKLQFPLLSAVVVPKELLPAKSSTVLLASAVPVKVGVVSPVMLSVLELPVSEEGARSGVDGIAVDVSMVIDREADALDTFPATSVAFAVMA